MHFNGRLLRRDKFHVGKFLPGHIPQFETERYEISGVLLHQSFRCAVKRCHSISFHNV